MTTLSVVSFVRLRGPDTPPVILAGNKRDAVTDATTEAFNTTTARVTSMVDNDSRLVGAVTSAATGEGVLAAFAALARRSRSSMRPARRLPKD
jgi:hypothetical protein